MSAFLQLDVTTLDSNFFGSVCAFLHLPGSGRIELLQEADSYAEGITLRELLDFHDEWTQIACADGLKIDVTQAFDELVVELAEVA